MQTADDLNTLFAAIGNSLSRDVDVTDEQYLELLERKRIKTPNSMFLSSTTPQEIIQIVSMMKTKESQNIYSWNVQLLKRAIEYLAEPLSRLVNSCIECGYFPEELKVAKVLPLYKKDNQNICGNYRLISILPVISKIFYS
ncbi:hypothetical protein HHI36_023359 [Cryptolaemus montrouzieri]|uniref:Uncharacterized protein n=1 Tax=Cryptolaemus montrouzieri TaxID=559131 RepID=A0ABD2PG55_9CUCU